MYFILYTLWLLTYPYVFSICGDSWLLFTYLHHFTIIDCHRLLSDLKNKMLCTRCLVWYTIVLYYHCIMGYLPSSGQLVKQSFAYILVICPKKKNLFFYRFAGKNIYKNTIIGIKAVARPLPLNLKRSHLMTLI